MSFSLLPKVVYQTQSKISGEILVEEQFGKMSLRVQGVTQSGWFVRGFWKKVLRTCRSEFQKPRCLILGLGGGSVVGLINKFWPEAKITGVEIDPEIIKIGKQFFDLNEAVNLKIIKANAFNWSPRLRAKYDLILVDLYLGKKFPRQAESEAFIRGFKKLLSKNGVVVFNRLKTDDTKKLEEKMKKNFRQVEVIKAPTNLLFVARS
jgi:spermidine synthase